MEAGKAKPLGSISREDVRHTLHTYFHAQAAVKTHPRLGASSPPSASTSSGSTQSSQPSQPVTAGGSSGRKRVFSFVQVQKTKAAVEGKRRFGHGLGGGGASASKYYVLCVTVQDQTVAGASASRLELHYLQLLSNFSVDVRHTWDLSGLDTVEHNGLGPDKTRGAFALFFSGEQTSWQWLVDPREAITAMHEFLWSLCALASQQDRSLPRLVRITVEELQETATRLSLTKKYELDVDLLRPTTTKKSGSPEDDGAAESDENGGKKSLLDNHVAVDASGLRLTSPESDDALQLLADVNWSDAQLSTVEGDLRKKLRTLEDENIAFLLSLDGDAAVAPLSSAVGLKPPSKSPVSSVEKILEAIDAVQQRVALIQAWTNESDEFLGQTSSSMQHFEALNNQLEMHFKNSVALEAELAKLMAQVEIPRDHMRVLLTPVDIFPGDGGATSSTSVLIDRSAVDTDTGRDLGAGGRMKATLAAIACMDQAIKSTQTFPANEMAAFRARGDELIKLAATFSEKLCVSFEAFLQRKVKPWTNSRALSGGSNGGNGSGRDRHDPSSSREVPKRSGVESRLSRVITAFEGGEAEDMNWSFTSEPFHAALTEYQSLLAHVNSLDPRALATLRQIYSKQLAGVYNAHMLSLFRCLRDKLPKPTKHHFHKPASMQSRGFHLSSSHFSIGDTMCASPLMQQALDHFIPLVLSEQRVVVRLFFPGTHDRAKPGTGRHELEELTLMMESVFEKLLKRMNEFGEAAATRNILDALALIVLVNGELEGYRQQSEFLFNIMVSFQLQMKRMLIKFTEEQQTWISSQNVDTKMAGVLSPVKKTVNLIARMEESVCGKTDDSTLISIYNLIVPATLQWVDKIADSRPKYAALTRLENYLFLADNLRGVNSSKDLPLAQYAAEAQTRYTENLERYVASVWEYAFKQLVPLFSSIETLLTTVPAPEIQYHSPRQEVRRVLDATSSSFEKSIKVIHDRIKKHCRENPKILPHIWKQVVVHGSSRLAVYALIAGDCYQLRLEPSPERGLELMNKFALT